MLPNTEYLILLSYLLISTTLLLSNLRPIRQFSSRVANPIYRLLRRSIVLYLILVGLEKSFRVGGPYSFDLYSKIRETSKIILRSSLGISRLFEVR